MKRRSLAMLVLGTLMCVVALPASDLALSSSASAAQASTVRPWGRSHIITSWHNEPLRPLAFGAHTRSSANWAGLLDTNAYFTGIGATWIVPAVKPSIPIEDSGAWIGIDGLPNDSSLIQTGTSKTSGEGTTLYLAWYELIPARPVYIGYVNPGDQMSASIIEVSPNNWRLSISDVTQKETLSSVFFYPAAHNSAEWIMEPPLNTDTGTLGALPNFGSVTFSDLSVQGNGLNLALVEPIQIKDYATGQVLASSTGLSSNDSVTVTDAQQGYDIVGADGAVYSYSAAPFLGSMVGTYLSRPVVGMANDDDTGGYWLVASDGGIFAFYAPFYGSMGGTPLNKPIVGMALDPQTGGYWEVASDGGIFAFNAPFLGSMGGTPLNQPIVGMTPTPDGNGYWLVASDGGIFAFGDAVFSGSTGGTPLNQPVVGMASDISTGGYWLVASDGGIFAFNAPFYGSMGASFLNRPIVGMAPTQDAGGYWLVASDGGIFSFGDGQFQGSRGGSFLPAPIVGMAVAG